MKTFYPRISRDVEASFPHPDNTVYRVSVGDEDWDGSFMQVIKVQMVYNGITAGRKSPSYPIGTDDFARVSEVIKDLEKEYQVRRQNIMFYPSKPVTTVPYSQRLMLIQKIPFGKIAREEDIDEYISKAYNTDHVTYKDIHMPMNDNFDNPIPYWRVVGKGGRITMGSRYTMSREAKIRHLSDEGISTEAFGNDLVRVVNYKDYLFDLSVIDPSDIISKPGTENTTDSVIRTFLMDSDKIKGVPDEMLMMISEERCSANDTADRIKMLENIKRELERRKNKRK